MRAVADSERWRPEQTHPGRLAGHAVEVDRASGYGFKCANRISIFLRSRCDCSKPSVPANDRATSRACSWMSRGILRWFLWTALRFERTCIAIELAGAIQKRLALVHGAARPELC